MKELIPMDEYGMFADMKDTARVDSRLVAQMFEKEHKNVLRDIDMILSPNPVSAKNLIGSILSRLNTPIYEAESSAATR